MVETTAFVIRSESDSELYERVRAVVLERYAAELYRPSSAERADVDVRLLRDAGAVTVADAPRHRVLYDLLGEQFEAEQSRCETVDDARLVGAERLGFDIDAQGQLAEFQSFGRTVPNFLRNCFPIKSERGAYEVHLSDVALQPPATPLATRWVVVAELSVFDTRALCAIESGRYALSSFLGPRENGRVGEPGQRLGRPFDEAEDEFFKRVSRALREEAPARLRAAEKEREPPRLTNLLDLQMIGVARS